MLWEVVCCWNYFCHLTLLELRLRKDSGERGYSGGFKVHFMVPVLGPADLDRSIQISSGIAIGIPIAVYGTNDMANEKSPKTQGTKRRFII